MGNHGRVSNDGTNQSTRGTPMERGLPKKYNAEIQRSGYTPYQIKIMRSKYLEK